MLVLVLVLVLFCVRFSRSSGLSTRACANAVVASLVGMAVVFWNSAETNL